jgi:hypothetical protein
VGAAEAAKYKHTHAGENPATDSTKAPMSATAKVGSEDEAKKARAEWAAAAAKAAAAPKAPAPSPRKPAAKRPANEAATKKRASADHRKSQSITSIGGRSHAGQFVLVWSSPEARMTEDGGLPLRPRR